MIATKYIKILGSLLILLLALSSCSQSDDGLISAMPDDQEEIKGQSFYLDGQLDSGAIYHAMDDSMYILLESFWILSDCSIDGIKYGYSDTKLYFSSELTTSNDITCSDLDLDFDSLLFMPPFWNEDDTIIRLLADENDFLSTSFNGEYEKYVADSILLKHGEISDSIREIGYDSLFLLDSIQNYYVKQGDLELMRRINDTLVINQYLELVEQQCLDGISNCEAVNDTVLSRVSTTESDTILAWLRKACVDDSIVYCQFSEWKTDTLTMDTIVIPWVDTAWNYQNLFIESVSGCTHYNRWKRQVYLKTYPDTLEIWREVIDFDSEKENCNTTQSKKIYYDISSGALDSLVSDDIQIEAIENDIKKFIE